MTVLTPDDRFVLDSLLTSGERVVLDSLAEPAAPDLEAEALREDVRQLFDHLTLMYQQGHRLPPATVRMLRNRLAALKAEMAGLARRRPSPALIVAQALTHAAMEELTYCAAPP